MTFYEFINLERKLLEMMRVETDKIDYRDDC